MTLKRVFNLQEGIFGILYKEGSTSRVCYTIEHAYRGEGHEEWKPKIPKGTYLCKRGEHQLRAQPNPFETYEVTGVNGHWGIVFHVGNRNDDSEGCILVGTGYDNLQNPRAVTSSRVAFSLFMELQDGCDSFSLKVE